MMRTPNEDGIFQGVVPQVLMTSTAQWGMNIKLTGSSQSLIQGSGDSPNAINAVTRAWNIVPKFSNYITDSDAFFVLGQRPPVNIVFTADGRPHLKPVYIDPLTDDWIWRAKGEWANVTDTWRGVVGSTGA